MSQKLKAPRALAPRAAQAATAVGRLGSAGPGAAFALISALLFGASTPVAKLLLRDGLNPQLLAGLFYLGSGFGLGAILLIRRASGVRGGEARLRHADLPSLSLAVLLGGAIAPVLMMSGLALISAASASLLQNLEGLATMGIAWVVFHENVDRRLLLGAFAILAGALLLSWSGGTAGAGAGTHPAAGALLIAGACLAWGADNNVTRKLAAADPAQIASIKGTVAGAANLGLALAIGAHAPAAGVAAIAAGVGFFAYGVSLVLFVLALRHLGAARTAAYYSTAPFIGAVLSILWLGEPLTAQLGGAAVLMGVGLYLHLAERHEHLHRHVAIEHEHRHVHDEHHQHEHGPQDAPGEPHSHPHRHEPLMHRHRHYPDLHHRHEHESS